MVCTWFLLVWAEMMNKNRLTGVPRILEGTLPPHFAVSESDTDWTEDFEEFMRGTRINVNVRQVFPKGFDPGA